MNYSETCEVCKKELKGVVVFVKCSYWNAHPLSECGGGCVYPVGAGCAKHIPKEFIERETTVDALIDEMEQYNKEVDEQ